MSKEIIFITVSLLLAISCSRNYHPYIKNNTVINEFNTHFYNDSLKVSISFPGDVEIYSDSLRHYYNIYRKNTGHLNKLKQKNILFRGKTTVPPFYDFLFISSKNELFPKEHSYEEKMLSQLLQGKFGDIYYSLISISSKSGYSNMTADQNVAFNSIKYGVEYRSKIPENPFDIIINQLHKDELSNYLNAYLQLYNVRKNYIADEDKFSFQQAMLTVSSMIKNSPVFDSLNIEYNSRRALKIDFIDKFIDDNKTFIDEDARKTLINIADTSRIVMFNELHWDRATRVFINSILSDFKKLGYEYLAMEALWDIDSSLTQLNYPTKSSGFYVLEPSMANLIRTAKSMGFTLISYDSQDSDREITQAKNIYNKTINVNRNAKVLVYTGVGHIHEKSDIDKPMMAAEFNRLYGIDPVTFDIHLLSMNKELMKNQELVLVSRKDVSNWASPKIQTDFYLGISENSNFTFNKKTDNKYIIDELPDLIKQNKQPLYSQLYLRSEFEKTGLKSIPLQNHWGINTEYYLNKGEYKWFIVNVFGDILREKDIAIK